MDKTARFNRISLLVVILFSASALYSQMISQEQRRATDTQQLQLLKTQLQQTYALQKEAALQKARRLNWPVRKVYPDGRVMELQGVQSNGMPLYYITYNLDAAVTTKTNELWSGGLLGLGLNGVINLDGFSTPITIGEWDGGAVRFRHNELIDRIFHEDIDKNSLLDESNTIIADSISSHATHVAGTLIAAGVDPDARGMANQAILSVWDFNSDYNEAVGAAANGLILSNHSYGPITGWIFDFFGEGKWTWFGGENQTEDIDFGYYSSRASDWDNLIYDAPYYLPVFAAGNDRNDVGPAEGDTFYVWIENNTYETRTTNPPPPDGEFDTISGAGVAKNVLTVGAIDDIPGGFYGDSEKQMSLFSSWGPVDDGRIKPDLVANGISLYSTDDSSNNDYGFKTGTSMAAPNVTGSFALLQELFIEKTNIPMRAATLKGLAIQTATDSGRSGPDYEWGWGILNSAKAAQLILDATSDSTQSIIEDSLLSDESIVYEFNVSSAQPFVATLSWTDFPGISPERIRDNRQIILRNDLNMAAITTNFPADSSRPWVLDPNSPALAANTGDNDIDNVEQIYVQYPHQDTYKVLINHDGSLADGQQSFSLIVNAPLAYVSNRSPRIANGLESLEVEEDFSEQFVAVLDSIFFDTSPDLSFSVETDSKSNAQIINDSLFVSSVPDSFGTSLVVVTAADSQFARKDTLIVDILPVNDPPEPFALNEPMDDFYNRTQVQLEFQWHPSSDIDDEEVTYLLTFRMSRNGDTLFTTTGDTSLSVHLLNLDLPRETAVEWDVLATDSEDSTSSNNGPFILTLSDELEIVNIVGGNPQSDTLLYNYPNPFNLARNNYTSIAFGLAKSQPVNITIFDLQGRVIKNLVNDTRDAGWHKEEWNGQDNSGVLVGSGVYFYRIATPGFIDTKKLLLLK